MNKIGGLSRTTYMRMRAPGGTLSLEILKKLYQDAKKLGKQSDFMQLRYRGIPVSVSKKITAGNIYFVSDHQDEDVIWAMRSMANEIEGKKTRPWDRWIWKIKRLLRRGDFNE